MVTITKLMTTAESNPKPAVDVEFPADAVDEMLQSPRDVVKMVDEVFWSSRDVVDAVVVMFHSPSVASASDIKFPKSDDDDVVKLTS